MINPHPYLGVGLSFREPDWFRAVRNVAAPARILQRARATASGGSFRHSTFLR